MIIDNQKVSNSGSNRKRISYVQMFWKCLSLFFLLSIIANGIMIVFFATNVIDFGQLKTNKSQYNGLIKQLKHQLEQCNEKELANGVYKRKSQFNVYCECGWIGVQDGMGLV